MTMMTAVQTSPMAAWHTVAPREAAPPWRGAYKHGGGVRRKKGGKGGSSAALSALALLAFLFFLNMLQTSLKESAAATTTQPPAMVEMLILPSRGQKVKPSGISVVGKPWGKKRRRPVAEDDDDDAHRLN